MQIESVQSSNLLPELFRGIDEEQRLSVLHIGSACGDTIDFFSQYRCRLHVFDLFSELPVPEPEETERGLDHLFEEWLDFPEGTQFDLCLLWDLFDYLDAPAITAFLRALRRCIGPRTRAHGFTVHNPRTPSNNALYGVHSASEVSLRHRRAPLPNYHPHGQNKLPDLLQYLRIERTVLLPDRRLELLLRAKSS